MKRDLSAGEKARHEVKHGQASKNGYHALTQMRGAKAYRRSSYWWHVSKRWQGKWKFD